MVLVELREGRRHESLAVGVVQGVVDRLGRHAEPRRRVPIDVDVELEPGVLLVGVHVLELGELAQRVEHAAAPTRSSSSRFASCTVYWYCVRPRRPPTFTSWRACRYVVMPSILVSLPRSRARICSALACRWGSGLSVMNALPVLPVPKPPGADERYVVPDVRIAVEHVVDLGLQAQHLRERDVLRRLGHPHEQPVVLLREETLGDDDEEGHVDCHREPSVTTAWSAGGEAPSAGRARRMPGSRRSRAPRARGAARAGTSASGRSISAHIVGRHCQRDERRDRHGDAQCDGELAEQASDDAAHQQDGDEHGEQRHRDRHDREPDLSGAIKRRPHPRLTGLQGAHEKLIVGTDRCPLQGSREDPLGLVRRVRPDRIPQVD